MIQFSHRAELFACILSLAMLSPVKIVKKYVLPVKLLPYLLMKS